MKTRALASLGMLALAIALLAAPALAVDDPLARIAINGAAIDWQPLTQHGFTLTVSGPDGFYFQDAYGAGDIASLSDLKDGHYTYEVRALVKLPLRSIVQDQDRGLQQATPTVEPQSGYFRVVAGTIVGNDVQEEATASTGGQGGLQNLPAADQVFLDDLIVGGSICAGFDCNNGESFGFDTLVLKENNLRLFFNDTSVSASFPQNDWRLVANDTSNGGANHFSIEDATAGRSPFRVEAGASANALVVEQDSDIGLGTLNPLVELHVVDGDTPTLRLEQDGSSGFTPQTYDVASNEANFFIRDVTNGSRLVFKIKPGAPTSSIFVAADGDIGLGTESPSGPLHVGTANHLVVEQGTGDVGIGTNVPGGTALRILRTDDVAGDAQLNIEANLSPAIDLIDQSNTDWRITASTGSIFIADIGTGADVPEEFELSPAGNMVIQGNYFSVTCTESPFMPCAPDYVFEDDYSLLPLDEVRAFIEENKHLPNVPSAQELVGPVNVSKLQFTLLEKIEELTLYTLDQEDQIDSLETENSTLKARLDALEAKVDALLQ